MIFRDSPCAPAEIDAEIKRMDRELEYRFGPPPYAPTSRERILVECVAELRLRVAQFEQNMRKMIQPPPVCDGALLPADTPTLTIRPHDAQEPKGNR